MECYIVDVTWYDGEFEYLDRTIEDLDPGRIKNEEYILKKVCYSEIKPLEWTSRYEIKNDYRLIELSGLTHVKKADVKIVKQYMY